jgi:HEAT repeat protein
MSFGSYLAAIRDETKPIGPSLLTQFSDLTKQKINLLKAEWKDISTNRRREIVDKLKIMADVYVELNFDRMFELCLDDPDGEVRKIAIEGLWECEDLCLIPRLVRVLKQDQEVKVRSAACATLGNFILLYEEGKASIRNIFSIIDVLMSVVYDEDENLDVTCKAVQALSPLSMPCATEAIQKAYRLNDLQSRAIAVLAMGRNGNPGWFSTIVSELGSPHPEIKIAAVRACGEMGKRTYPYLKGLLQDPDAKIREEVANILNEGILTSPEAGYHRLPY